MAFAPDYASSGRFYVYFTDRNGDTRVQEFRRSQRQPEPRRHGRRARQILFDRQPYPNHNGGLLLFGPDGLSTSAWATAARRAIPENRAQNLDSLLGKILRIDPRRSGRPLPLAGVEPVRRAAPGATRSTPTACATRGASRSTAATGDLYIGDVGQDARRGDRLRPPRRRARAQLRLELLRGPAPLRRLAQLPGRDAARARRTGAAAGDCSVTGGVVVRDPELPALAGRYVYGDYCAAACAASGSRAAGRPATARWTARRRSSARSARTRAGASTRRRSTGPVYRLRSR